MSGSASFQTSFAGHTGLIERRNTRPRIGNDFLGFIYEVLFKIEWIEKLYDAKVTI
jgi:hypothetical protein